MAANGSVGGDYICTLSPELVTKAQEELNEKKEWRSRDIQALRDMVQAHKGLKCPTDDAFLLKFLRARKFDYDRAYQLILNYYEVRAINQDVFKDFVPSALKHMFDDGVTAILPDRDRHGRRVVLFRPGRWNHEKYSIYENLRTNVMCMEKVILDYEDCQINGVVILAYLNDVGLNHAKHLDRNYAKLMIEALQEEDVQVNGVVLVVNALDVGMAHARSMERNYAKLFSSIVQDAFPARLKGIFIVNEPSIIGYIFTIIKPFLKEKLSKRLRFFGTDHAALKEEVGEDCLPEELGGKAGPIDTIAAQWKETMLASEAHFQEMARYTLEVPREIIKKKNEEAVDCLVGTYKKLSVD